ncbi:hypothetical protein UFOVP1196_43 [uncultured Caudovirales phage]|uniref:Uncharacterized protein n=1 Tax=uncultured Caudovirales phage TaxID=2100421 RepID=A0A6J5RF49_9CAUD|nr:hypothetical protein UFOVP1196_43 [uncultured Caudovirales phage]
MNGSTRLRDAYTEAPARCGYCSSKQHVSTECPDVSEEEVLEYNHSDALSMESSHTLDPVVRCALCGTPTHERRSAFYVRDTQETICNNCGRDDV